MTITMRDYSADGNLIVCNVHPLEHHLLNVRKARQRTSESLHLNIQIREEIHKAGIAVNRG